MRPVILVRHGRSTANGAGVLAGRAAGIGLDETGRAQAVTLVERLAPVRVGRVVCSPLQRCRETVQPLAQRLGVTVEIDDRLAEVEYGGWSGRSLAELREDPLWAVVQNHPSAMVFPEGEAMAAVSARAVSAAREYGAEDGTDGAVLLCSHGDVIAMILADALGMHLDLFQRLTVSPASASVIHYLPGRPAVQCINDTAGPLQAGAPQGESTGGDPGREQAEPPRGGQVA